MIYGACKAMRASWRNCFSDEILTLPVSRQVVIQNRRLSIMWRLAQATLVCWLVAYSVYAEVWVAPHAPKGYGLRLTWGPQQTEDNRSAHCSQLALYRFNTSTGRAYAPTSCEPLLPNQAYHSQIEHMLLPTYVDEVTVWRSSNGICDPSWCSHTCSGRSAACQLDACQCREQRSYFAKNPEFQRISLWHGYEVDTSDGQGLGIARGTIGTPKSLMGSANLLNEKSGHLVTRLVTPQGEPCSIGGLSEWSMEVASLHGISGTFQEWMACAGVALDDNPQSLLPDRSLPAHLRLMGFTLLLTLDYRSTTGLFSSALNVVCTISAQVQVAWTEMPLISEVVEVATPTGLVEAVRTWGGQGVAVRTQVVGIFKTFDMARLVAALVNFIVLFRLPRYFTQFVALYCLGLVSEIYRRARRTKVSAYNDFKHALTRSMMAETSFRAMVGGRFTESISGMGVTPSLWLDRLTELFQQQIEDGQLCREDLQAMAVLTFKHLDTGSKGMLTCQDFITSASTSEFFDLGMMGRFFSSTTPQGLLQAMLDNSRHRQRASLDSQASIEVLHHMSTGLGVDGNSSDVGSVVSSAGREQQQEAGSVSSSGCHPHQVDVHVHDGSRKRKITVMSTEQECNLMGSLRLEERIASLEARHEQRKLAVPGVRTGDLEARLSAVEDLVAQRAKIAFDDLEAKLDLRMKELSNFITRVSVKLDMHVQREDMHVGGCQHAPAHSSRWSHSCASRSPSSKQLALDPEVASKPEAIGRLLQEMHPRQSTPQDPKPENPVLSIAPAVQILQHVGEVHRTATHSLARLQQESWLNDTWDTEEEISQAPRQWNVRRPHASVPVSSSIDIDLMAAETPASVVNKCVSFSNDVDKTDVDSLCKTQRHWMFSARN